MLRVDRQRAPVRVSHTPPCRHACARDLRGRYLLTMSFGDLTQVSNSFLPHTLVFMLHHVPCRRSALCSRIVPSPWTRRCNSSFASHPGFAADCGPLQFEQLQRATSVHMWQVSAKRAHAFIAALIFPLPSLLLFFLQAELLRLRAALHEVRTSAWRFVPCCSVYSAAAPCFLN